MKSIVKKYMEYKEAFVQGFKDGRAEAAQEEKMYRENTERIISGIKFPEPVFDFSEATERLHETLEAMRVEREERVRELFKDTRSDRLRVQAHLNKEA